MDNYYLNSLHTTTSAGSSFFLPFGVTLAAVPTLYDVVCNTPGISVNSIIPSSTGLSITVSPSVASGTEFDWMVTTANSIKALFRSSMLEFDELDQASATQGTDKSLLIRSGAPKSFAFSTLASDLLDGAILSGITVIPAGQEEVSVVFDTPFASDPSIALTPMHNSASAELITGVITALSTNGFTYTLAAEAPANASILWTAASVT